MRNRAEFYLKSGSRFRLDEENKEPNVLEILRNKSQLELVTAAALK